MLIPPNFQFSQGSLQDYLDCRQRFLLRYVYHRQWPAIEAEPVVEHERFMLQGARFHRMVQQHLAGVPGERLTALAETGDDEDLERWWQSFLAFIQHPAGSDCPAPLAGRCYPELALSACLADHNLVARYDLLLFAPAPETGMDGHKVYIYDWKTSRGRPQRQRLTHSMQTRVYPYLLVQAGACLNGGPIQPEQVEMIYWFPGFPDQPVHLPYSPQRCREDEQFLAGLVTEICRQPVDAFTPTDLDAHCRFCIYRSLCGRGEQAGELGSQGEESPEPGEDGKVNGTPGLDLDFEQIAEIKF